MHASPIFNSLTFIHTNLVSKHACFIQLISVILASSTFTTSDRSSKRQFEFREPVYRPRHAYYNLQPFFVMGKFWKRIPHRPLCAGDDCEELHVSNRECRRAIRKLDRIIQKKAQYASHESIHRIWQLDAAVQIREDESAA